MELNAFSKSIKRKIPGSLFASAYSNRSYFGYWSDNILFKSKIQSNQILKQIGLNYLLPKI